MVNRFHVVAVQGEFRAPRQEVEGVINQAIGFPRM